MVAPSAPDGTVTGALNRYPWHADAACQAEDDWTLFFPEEPSSAQRRDPGAPSILLPLLLCERCPVRSQCLEEGLRHQRVELRPGQEPISYQAWGIWGGTTRAERAEAAATSPSRAFDLLDRTLPQRLEIRIGDFRARYGTVDIARWTGPAALMRTAGMVERVRALLAERSLTDEEGSQA